MVVPHADYFVAQSRAPKHALGEVGDYRRPGSIAFVIPILMRFQTMS